MDRSRVYEAAWSFWRGVRRGAAVLFRAVPGLSPALSPATAPQWLFQCHSQQRQGDTKQGQPHGRTPLPQPVGLRVVQQSGVFTLLSRSLLLPSLTLACPRCLPSTHLTPAASLPHRPPLTPTCLSIPSPVFSTSCPCLWVSSLTPPPLHPSCLASTLHCPLTPSSPLPLHSLSLPSPLTLPSSLNS